MILRFFDSISTKPRMSGTKVLALTLVAFSSPLYADEPAQTEASKEEVSPFSGVASLNLRSSTTSRSDYDYRIFLAAGVNLEYDFTDVVTVGLSVRGNQDLNNEQRSTLTDTTVSVSRQFKVAKGLGLGVDGSYSAPVSKDLIKYSNHKGTWGASGSASYAFEGVLTGLAVNAGLSYERYLYQYEYANGGQILTKYALNQVIGFSYKWQDITFSTSYTNISSWDFDNEKENDSYLWVETLQYRIDKAWAVQAGHISNGNAFDYLGAANNVQFYDRRRSQVFVGTSYAF